MKTQKYRIMQGNKTFAPTGAKNKPIGILGAIAVMLVTLVILLPCYMVANCNDNIEINIMGAAYIGLLALLSRTRAGRAWTMLVERTNNRLFGWLTSDVQ